LAHPPIEIVTFDCYGTLIGWDGGVATFLTELALVNGDANAPNGRALREHWETIQFDLIRGPYQRYEAILAESLQAWAEERGYGWAPAWGVALARAMRSWQPFPDTRPALTKVREAGLKLAIISNTDETIIAQTLRHLEIPFDAVITAESCGAYKPDPAVFAQAQERLGVAPEQILHVAFGFKYDIGPAQAAGWRTAWINRYAETKPGPASPDYEWRDLWGLAALVG